MQREHRFAFGPGDRLIDHRRDRGRRGRPARSQVFVLAQVGDAGYLHVDPKIEKRRGELVEALPTDTGRGSLTEMEVDSVIANLQRCSGLVAVDAGRKGGAQRGWRRRHVSRDPGCRWVAGVIETWDSRSNWRSSTRCLHCSRVRGPEVGRAVVDLVVVGCFIGCVRSGRNVARAADRFIRTFLELGGKGPTIVAGSADVDVATSAVLGRDGKCGSVVHVDRAGVCRRGTGRQFVSALAGKAARCRLDVTGDGSGDIGRCINTDRLTNPPGHHSLSVNSCGSGPGGTTVQASDAVVQTTPSLARRLMTPCWVAAKCPRSTPAAGMVFAG